jgi:hypothetical protein
VQGRKSSPVGEERAWGWKEKLGKKLKRYLKGIDKLCVYTYYVIYGGYKL